MGAGLWLLFTTGCLVAEHRSYETPLDTAQSFQSAFARDDEVGEYHCLSLQRQEAVSLQGYGTLHDQLFEPLGPLGRSILKRNSLRDNVCAQRSQQQRKTLWFCVFGQTLEVAFRREPLLRLHAGAAAETVEAPITTPPRPSRAGILVSLSLPMRFVERLHAEGLSQVEWFHHWKIDDFRLARELPEVNPGEVRDGEETSAATVSTEEVRELHWSAAAPVLGFQAVELQLPLSRRARQNLLNLGRPVQHGKLCWVVQGQGTDRETETP